MDTYMIPVNFTEAGRLLGLFPVRNTIEAAVLALPLFFILIALLPLAMTIRLTVAASFAIPLGGIALMGIGDDSLTQHLRALWHYLKNKKILTHRGGTHGH